MSGNTTQDQIEKSYIKGKLVFDDAKPLSEAINELFSDASMNRSSATGHVRNFLRMVNGEEYQRTLNVRATEYFLASIHKDYGKEFL